MNINGEKLLPASLGQAWDSLNDTNVLQRCIPGCETLEQLTESEFRLVLAAVVGPIRVRFVSKLTLQDVVPESSYVMLFEGSGGGAGFGSGSARVKLDENEHGVKLTYEAQAKIGGKLAQVGSRLIDGVAKKLAAEFFTRFNDCLAGGTILDGGESAPEGSRSAKAQTG
ncbi:SRPBCC family protein [Eoetvoesiella caeni]